MIAGSLVAIGLLTEKLLNKPFEELLISKHSKVRNTKYALKCKFYI